jgi:hypothetical protein
MIKGILFIALVSISPLALAKDDVPESRKVFFDGFWLREKYSPALLKKKYFDYQYEYLEKTFIEGPPTHKFTQGKVSKKFVFNEKNGQQLQFVRFDNIYDYQEVLNFYDVFSKKQGAADLVYTKDYFWAKGFRAEWLREDGKYTEILDATYKQTLAGVSYEVSHYYFENSYRREKSDLRIPEKNRGIQYQTYTPNSEFIEMRPVIRNREIEKGVSFKLNLAGIDLNRNLSYDSLKSKIPGIVITSSPRDFEKYKYVAFDHKKCNFELEYHFSRHGQVSTIYMRNITIGHSHEILNELLQSKDKPYLAYTRQYKREFRQPENWLIYIDKDKKMMAIIRLSPDFIDPYRFQIAVDIREYESLPDLPKETLTYEHKLMQLN